MKLTEDWGRGQHVFRSQCDGPLLAASQGVRAGTGHHGDGILNKGPGG